MEKKYEDIYESLKNEVQQVAWDALDDHYKRGAVLMLEAELDLIEVATKVAIDDVDSIRDFLKDKALRKPTGDEIIEFQNDEEELKFDFLIIQPYVLVKQLIDLDDL